MQETIEAATISIYKVIIKLEKSYWQTLLARSKRIS
jgi:hypothetical protein